MIIGGFYLIMAGLNIGLITANPQVYAGFAENPLFGFVHAGWKQIVMAEPRIWIGLLAAGEIMIGSCLLAGGPWARAGYLAVIAFHLLLMLFGFWAWVWALPVLVLLVLLARREFRYRRGAGPTRT